MHWSDCLRAVSEGVLLGAYYDGFEPLAVVGEPAYTSSGKNVPGVQVM